jgi:hypothetical protein
MKILLDECVPLQVRDALPNHDVTSAQRMGWGGISNGDLLDQAEREGFQVFILADKNLRFISKIFPAAVLPFSNSGRIIAQRWKNISQKSTLPWKNSRRANILFWKFLEIRRRRRRAIFVETQTPNSPASSARHRWSSRFSESAARTS